MRSIEETAEEWLVEFGRQERGKNGPYRRIEFAEKKDVLLVLVRTLIDEGYGQEILKTQKTINIIINTLEPRDSNTAAIRKIKEIHCKDVKWALNEFFRGGFSKVVKTEESSNSDVPKEGTPEFEQYIADLDKDKIKIDAPPIKGSALDLDFLNELGIDEKDLK